MHYELSYNIIRRHAAARHEGGDLTTMIASSMTTTRRFGGLLRRACAGVVRSSTSRWNELRLETRLYAIIVLLGVLPAAGAMIAKVTIDSFTRDAAALDRLARGSISLQRIDGVVNAVVAESRGIYMSADWKAAEPFARNVSAKLAELQKLAQIRASEVIASQSSNVEELILRLGDFIRLQTELVRIAGEQGPAAARAMGDNDANRATRTALDDILSTVAGAYDRESAEAQSKIGPKEQGFLASLTVLALLSTLALYTGLTLVTRGLLVPLLETKDSMLRLAQGNLDIIVAGQARTDEIGEMARAVHVFQDMLIERQKSHRESELLSELNEWLQSCKSLAELYEIVGKFLTLMLPDCAGSLYIYANSRNVLDNVKSWNGAEVAQPMRPDDCWSLRRGHTVVRDDDGIHFDCAHVDPTRCDDYCCIPILAHGETIGMLHVTFHPDPAWDGATRKEAFARQRRLGLSCAEQISMAIANVKLRDQLQDQAIRDTLTGLFNRRYLLETCHREFSKAARTRSSVGILSIDIDHFKKYNDNHGHDAGDVLLRAFGECLESSFRGEDIACRLGGEEFIVVLPGASSDEAAYRAEELKASVESLVIRYLGRNLPKMTVSIGVAAFPDSGDTPEAVIRAADEALYRAKELGRNRVERAGAADPTCENASPTLPVAAPRALGMDLVDAAPERERVEPTIGTAA